MDTRLAVSILSAVLMAPASSSTAPMTAQATGVSRKMFVSATDKTGRPPQTLAPGDLIVKEADQVRPVVSIQRPTGPTRIALVVEADLAGDLYVHSAFRAFISRMSQRAQIAIVIGGITDTVIVDYTTDVDRLFAGVAQLFPRAKVQAGNRLAEAIFETARQLGKSEAERRIIVAVGVDRDRVLEIEAREILDELQKTGTMLFVAAVRGPTGTTGPAAMPDAAGLERVLSEGTVQSGGRFRQTALTSGFLESLRATADEIVQQYEVTYTLPAGVTPRETISVKSANSSLIVRGPTRIPIR